MKKLWMVMVGITVFSCGGKKAAEAPTPVEEAKANVVELNEGFTVELPAGEMQSQKVDDTTHVRIKGQSMVYSLSGPSNSGKACKEELAEAKNGLKDAREADPESFSKLMAVRASNDCGLHTECYVHEIGQRNPNDVKEDAPYREMISYSLCLEDKFFVLLGILLPSGTPVSDAHRATMKKVAQSIKPKATP